eukprot:5779867-Alexandrium_andersonii.AAC.1
MGSGRSCDASSPGAGWRQHVESACVCAAFGLESSKAPMARRIRTKSDPWAEVVQGVADHRAKRVSWMVVSSYDQEPTFDENAIA